MDFELRELLDREAIRDCLGRSALANDLCDAELWKQTYWPDGYEDHGSMFKGNAYSFIDAVGPKVRAGMDVTWHNIGNIIIRLDAENAANVTSYCFVYCRVVGEEQHRWDMMAGVRYLDKFEKRKSEWRILNRITKTDWRRDATDSLDWGLIDPGTGKPRPLGMRRPDDPLHGHYDGGMDGWLSTGLSVPAA